MKAAVDATLVQCLCKVEENSAPPTCTTDAPGKRIRLDVHTEEKRRAQLCLWHRSLSLSLALLFHVPFITVSRAGVVIVQLACAIVTRSCIGKELARVIIASWSVARASVTSVIRRVSKTCMCVCVSECVRKLRV